MPKPSRITLPNGTQIEMSSDLTPEQIAAMISAVAGAPGVSSSPPVEEEQTGKIIVHERTPDEIWNGSKKDRLALFIRTYMSENLWFTAKDIVEQQISQLGALSIGETSAIGTYLQRLFDSQYVDKKLNGRSVSYRMTEKLQEEFPLIKAEKFQLLVNE